MALQQILVVDELENPHQVRFVSNAVQIAEEWLDYGINDDMAFDHEDMCTVCNALIAVTYVDTVN